MFKARTIKNPPVMTIALVIALWNQLCLLFQRAFVLKNTFYQQLPCQHFVSQLQLSSSVRGALRRVNSSFKNGRRLLKCTNYFPLFRNTLPLTNRLLFTLWGGGGRINKGQRILVCTCVKFNDGSSGLCTDYSWWNTELCLSSTTCRSSMVLFQSTLEDI